MTKKEAQHVIKTLGIEDSIVSLGHSTWFFTSANPQVSILWVELKPTGCTGTCPAALEYSPSSQPHKSNDPFELWISVTGDFVC